MYTTSLTWSIVLGWRDLWSLACSSHSSWIDRMKLIPFITLFYIENVTFLTWDAWSDSSNDKNLLINFLINKLKCCGISVVVQIVLRLRQDQDLDRIRQDQIRIKSRTKFCDKGFSIWHILHSNLLCLEFYAFRRTTITKSTIFKVLKKYISSMQKKKKHLVKHCLDMTNTTSSQNMVDSESKVQSTLLWLKANFSFLIWIQL